jgi:hypothetical protein
MVFEPTSLKYVGESDDKDDGVEISLYVDLAQTQIFKYHLTIGMSTEVIRGRKAIGDVQKEVTLDIIDVDTADNFGVPDVSGCVNPSVQLIILFESQLTFVELKINGNKY